MLYKKNCEKTLKKELFENPTSEFRGTPFQPMDFLSIGTAAGVAGTYNFAPSYKLITAILMFIMMKPIPMSRQWSVISWHW